MIDPRAVEDQDSVEYVIHQREHEKALDKLHATKRRKHSPDILHESDVRCELFEEIPEPITRITDYQKILITETNDPIDEDTKLACDKLKKCLAIRDKWMSYHPIPPQDERKHFDDIEKGVTVIADIRKTRRATMNMNNMPHNNSSNRHHILPHHHNSPRRLLGPTSHVTVGHHTSHSSHGPSIGHTYSNPNLSSLNLSNHSHHHPHHHQSKPSSASSSTKKSNLALDTIEERTSLERNSDSTVLHHSISTPAVITSDTTQDSSDMMIATTTNMATTMATTTTSSMNDIHQDPDPNQDNDDHIDTTSTVDSQLEYCPIDYSDVPVESFRRRFVPTYQIFNRPIITPEIYDFTHDVKYTINMAHGIVNVTVDVTDKFPNVTTSTTTNNNNTTNNDDSTNNRQVIKTETGINNRNSTTTSTTIITNSTTTTDNKIIEYLPTFNIPQFDEFITDFNFIRQTVYSGPVMSYSYKRLELLSAKYNLYVLLNTERETEAQKAVPHRDFYNVRKVDTHVHHSACMNQKHLLRFIKHKLRHNPNEIVTFRDDKYLTLGEVFQSLGLTAYELSIDTLDMHAHDTFHRFDRFNLKYNPAGQSRLREIFLKTDNLIEGKYLADLTKEVMSDLEASKYQLVEWRVSIYGRQKNEWENLAKWFYINKLAHFNVRWLIQVPRLFHLYCRSNEVTSFGDMLANIFIPLFEATLYPEQHLELYYFLETIVGFDSVDDESRPEHGYLSDNKNILPPPDEWILPENPPYGYWMYYMYANICILNQLRASRKLCTFQFRPHCGEAGDVDHLISTYMVAHQINHGILLRKNPSLQYLYYLSQIGIAMSPLSNNKLFLEYYKNPFIKYFKQGMNVSLSTDDPLMLHYTKDALTEEYSVATQVWKLSSADQCEIARNSVLQSGWEARYKVHFLGEDYKDMRETNVPDIRLLYREENLNIEYMHLDMV